MTAGILALSMLLGAVGLGLAASGLWWGLLLWAAAIVAVWLCGPA